jgi:carbamate kinase
VVVDEDDPAFKAPTKPIGPILTQEQLARADYPVAQTAKGPRRVVASPRPVTIVEKREIKTLIRNNFIVICCGGGGIPVVREGRGYAGVDAVIDKDLASAKLAEDVGVNYFCIATDVPGLALDYGTSKERFLEKVTGPEAIKHLKSGQFPAGSMGPKVEACIKVLENGGQRAFICSTNEIEKALDQKAGTHFSL